MSVKYFNNLDVLRCATCSHYKQLEIEVKIKGGDAVYPHTTCINEIMLRKLRIRYSNVNNLHIEPTPDFGCPFHSDYKVENNG